MTENEASTCWCPFVRYKFTATNDVTPYNRSAFPHETDNLNCLGSGCMAWRWVQRITNQEELDRERNTLISYSKPSQPIYENTDHGFCGLAGRP